MVTIHEDRCKGCGYCMHFCPKQALSPSESVNDKGYRYVVIDPDKCISCGICYTVCPDSVFDVERR